MPDLTPDDPEPLVSAESMGIADPLMSEGWAVIPAEAPPAPVTVLNEATPGLERPIFTQKVRPVYPERALKLKLQGYVILQAVLRADGSVGDIDVVRHLHGGNFGFEQAAIQALQSWQFLPGRLNGEDVDVRMSLRIDFVLNR